MTAVTRRTRELPDSGWTAIDRAQNFAEAAVAQATRLSLEAAENGNHDGDVYFTGALAYADLIRQFIVETALDEDEKKKGERHG
jgi:hypothetical protein